MTPSNVEILAYEETELGLLVLRRRELLGRPGTWVTEISLNHEFLMSSYNTDSEVALSRIGIEFHEGEDLKVMVGGLGLGYTANAALETGRVQHLTVIEFLPEVIRWMEDELFPLAETLREDSRFALVRDDVYRRLLEPPTETWDLILIDVDHSPEDILADGENRFYTASGLWDATRHLAPGGVLGVWSYAESSPFADAMQEVFGEVRVEPIRFHDELVDEEHEDWLFFGRNLR